MYESTVKKSRWKSMIAPTPDTRSPFMTHNEIQPNDPRQFSLISSRQFTSSMNLDWPFKYYLETLGINTMTLYTHNILRGARTHITYDSYIVWKNSILWGNIFFETLFQVYNTICTHTSIYNCFQVLFAKHTPMVLNNSTLGMCQWD